MPGFIMNRLIISLVVALLFCTSNCLAEGRGFPLIKWEELGLTPAQQAKLAAADEKWSRIYNNLSNRITDKKNKMKILLCNPRSTDFEIRELQKKIFRDKEILRYQALEIFLEKRSILTPEQREMLREVLDR